MAIVVKIGFSGCMDGERKPRPFVPGDVLPANSDLARVALEQGWAEDSKKKGPANKARKGRLTK